MSDTATIVLEEGREVELSGSPRDVAELIGLYCLARQCVRDRIKVKDFRRMILAAEDAINAEVEGRSTEEALRGGGQ